ncbi:hypothetical protein FO519_007662 [Halicephalobus sp. NKZ332]|nr:hypothetical protein FO519_007662 [Halicephalobus sp. NKZ332]
MATAMISSDLGLRQFQQLNYCSNNPSQSRTGVQASRSPNSAEEVSSESERSQSRATVDELSPIRSDPFSSQVFRGETNVFGNGSGFSNAELFGSFGANSNLLPYPMNLHEMQQIGFVSSFF